MSGYPTGFQLWTKADNDNGISIKYGKDFPIFGYFYSILNKFIQNNRTI